MGLAKTNSGMAFILSFILVKQLVRNSSASDSFILMPVKGTKLKLLPHTVRFVEEPRLIPWAYL
jgi:hypothetical protein